MVDFRPEQAYPDWVVRRGRQIILRASTYEYHTAADHTEMVGIDANKDFPWMEETMGDPHLVLRDKRHPEREGFFRFRVLPG